MYHGVSGGQPIVATQFSAAINNPVSFQVDSQHNIDWNFIVAINTSNPLLPTFSLTYTHDCYPDYEVYEHGRSLYTFAAVGHNPITNIAPCLYGFGQISGIKSGSLF